MDLHALAVDVGADPLLEVAAHLLDEPARDRRRRALRPRAGRDPQRALPRRLRRRGIHALLVLHQGEHEVAALEGRLRVPPRIVMGGGLGQRGEQRGLGQGQLAGRAGEVVARRGLDAGGAVPEVDVVEVHLQDLVLGELALDLVGDADLEDLAAERPLPAGQRVGEDVPGELHRDRARPLLDTARAHVAPQRAEDPLQVHRAVVAEALVLDRDERFRHVFGKGGQLDELAFDGGEIGELLAVAVEEDGRPARDVRAQLVDVGAALEEAELPGDAEQDDDAGESQQDAAAALRAARHEGRGAGGIGWLIVRRARARPYEESSRWKAGCGRRRPRIARRARKAGCRGRA